MRNDKAETLAKFDFLVDEFNEGNHWEDTRIQFLKDLDTWLTTPECSRKEIKRLAGPAACYKYYCKMVQYGVTLNIHQLAKMASSKFVWNHLEGFIARGADINFLIGRIGNAVYSLDEMAYDPEVGERVATRLFKLGADAEKVFNLLETWLLNHFRFYGDCEIWDKLTEFENRGLSKDFVKQWLEDQMSENTGDILEEAFDKSSRTREMLICKYGVRILDYVDDYRTIYGICPYADSCQEVDDEMKRRFCVKCFIEDEDDENYEVECKFCCNDLIEDEDLDDYDDN